MLPAVHAVLCSAVLSVCASWKLNLLAVKFASSTDLPQKSATSHSGAACGQGCQVHLAYHGMHGMYAPYAWMVDNAPR